ncbi:hypothetical protein M1M07_28425 [Rhodococcus sp. HM1]|uniref:hypothetical protein n=1 Tax=Rhodococcus sp. HM1 TaxID=2937759 RepID=UPI00200B9B61|nr:hypothetical protein [Rhodococcus sp. HM1]MCK8675021.1 hypothetical protein [Rhodococcus sp. HM1]
MSIWLFRRAPTGVYLGARRATGVYWRGRAAWDGTMPANVVTVAATVVVHAVQPGVSAGATVGIPPASIGVSAAPVGLSAIVAVPAAQITLTAPAAEPGTEGAVVAIPSAHITLEAPAPVFATPNVAVPVADVLVAAGHPSAHASTGLLAVPAVQLELAAPGGAVSAGSAPAVPAAQLAVSAPAPIVRGAATVAVPAVDLALTAPAPQVTGSAVVAAPAAVVSVTAPAPVAQAIQFVPMGVDKSGTQDPGRDVYTMVTGWVPRAGFPDTVESGGKLIVIGNKTTTIYAQVTFNSGNLFITKGCRIVVNGTVVATSQSNGQNKVYSTNYSTTLHEGDEVWLEAAHTATTSGERNILAGASNTFLYWD